MKFFKNTIWALILLTTVEVSAQINFEPQTFEEAKKIAAKEGKPIFVDAYTTWCGPCKWMAKTVFTDPDVADYYNKNFVNLQLDMEKGKGVAFAKQYDVRVYPSLIYLDAEGKMMHRAAGARQGQDFIELGEIAKDPELNLAGSIQQFEEGESDTAFINSFFLKIEEAGLSTEPYAATYFKKITPNQLLQPGILQLFTKHASHVETEVFDYFTQHKEQISEIITIDVYNQKLDNAYGKAMEKALYAENETKYNQLREKYAELGTPEKDRVLEEAQLTELSVKKKIPEMLNKLADITDKYYMHDANRLNQLAWTFYEKIPDPDLNKRAEKWAKQATTLEPNNYAIADTYAALLYKNGKLKEAQKQAQKAIEMGQKNDEDVEGTKELMQKINEAINSK